MQRLVLPCVVCVVCVGCGRSELTLGTAVQETSGPRPPGPAEPPEATSTSGEDSGGVDEGPESSGDDGGPEVCERRPDIRWLRFYDGEALRTVAHDLERDPDGTLYLAGTRADETTMEAWIAAASPQGDIEWEVTGLSERGGNLAGGPPVVRELVQIGEVLLFAGVTYEQDALAWHGLVTTDGNILSDQIIEGVDWYGAAAGRWPTVFLGGRISVPRGSVLVRLDDMAASWITNTEEAGQFDDVVTSVAVGDGLFAAGSRDDLPWIGRFDPDSGAELWSVEIVEQADFEGEGGVMWALATREDLVVVGGDIRQHKPQPDGTGSVIYNELYLSAWSPQGELRWWWQRTPDRIRPGILHAVIIGPDGTIYATGTEADLEEDDSFFVGAWSPDGALRWSIDTETRPGDEDLVGLSGRGLALGEDGQLLVFADRRWLQEETTALLEVCF